MDFALTDEQTEFRATLRRFFDREVPLEVMTAIERGERPIQPVLDKMAELGLWELSLGEKWGGGPVDYLMVAIASEEVGRAGASLVNAWVPTVACCRTLLEFGTDEQRAAVLPHAAAGKLRMALALTEPSVGSDLTNLSTRAVREGEEFLVDGQKVFTTNAAEADQLLVFVRTDPEASAAKGLSVLMIPRDSRGITINPLDKLHAHATSTCEIFFDDVRVPASALIGELNRGLAVVLGLLNYERITNAAESIGVAQGAYELALKYAKERVQFGRPIIEHQAVGHKLADMRIDIETARLLTWRAAWKLQHGLPTELDAAMAKVAASECGTRCANQGMQILGGYSYMVDFGMERYWREAKVYEIVAGTNEILRNNIAKAVGRGAE